MEQETIGTTTVTPGVSGPPDILGAFIQLFSEVWGGDPVGGVFGFISTAWSIYTITAYLIALLLLYIFIYSSIRIGRLTEELRAGIAAQEEAWRQNYGPVGKQSRFAVIAEHVESTNPNDWKLAIIEADVLLDDSLKKLGLPGTTLGERLKSISHNSMQTLDDAWTAHKVRNQIVHGEDDFVLTQRLARDTIARYRNVFEELGVLDVV